MSSTSPSQGSTGRTWPGNAASQAADERQGAEVAGRLSELAAGVASLGPDATVSSWSATATAMTGYTLDQVRRIGLAAIFEPAEVMRHILYKGGAGVPTPSEYLQLRRGDGHLIPVVAQCAPQRRQRQNPCPLVLAFRAIDVHLEDLRQDEHWMVMGRFSSSLSHDMRNQLNAVMLHTDVLSDALDDAPSETRVVMGESVEDIRREINRLYELIDQVLSLGRLSRLELEPVMLATFIEALGEEIEPLLSSHGIRLHQRLSAELGEVGLHANTFRYLWLNLVHNAIEAMPDGGELSICAECSEDEARLTITDTGAGVAMDLIPLLFAPFHTTKPDGAGLGLYVAQEIAAAHHGRIEVSNERGLGASFTVTLPMVKPV